MHHVKDRVLAAVAVVVAATLAVPAHAACPTRPSWPTKTDWPVATPANKSAELKALEDYAFTTIGTDAERLGIRTDALLVIKGGTILYEKYARGWSASNRHISWSVAKSFSTALLGVAVNKGLVDLDKSICEYLTAYRGSSVCNITVKNMATFGPGLQWQEEYEDQGYQGSSVISMLLGVGHVDQVDFVLKHRQLYEPGTQFIYSTGTAHVVSTLAKKALAAKYGNDAFWSQFFEPLGMGRTVFEEDVRGNPLGGSYVYATARDYAKFGYLFLNDGCWENTRLLPENWVKDSTTINDAFKSNRGDCANTTPAGSYPLSCNTVPSGYMWWLNQPPAADTTKPYKDLPDDAYVAIGHWGQYILVVPSADTVIVRLGDDRDDCPDTEEAKTSRTVNGVPCRFSLNTLGKLALEVAK